MANPVIQNSPEFALFAEAFEKSYNTLSRQAGRTVGVACLTGDDVWDLYMQAIPEEHNQIVRERREHDSNHDRAVIRNVGNLLFVVDGKFKTIWGGIDTGTWYDDVASHLNARLLDAGWCQFKVFTEESYGRKLNPDMHVEGHVWRNLEVTIHRLQRPTGVKSAASIMGERNTNLDVLMRGMDTDAEAIETLREAAVAGDIYRSADLLPALKQMSKAVKLANEPLAVVIEAFVLSDFSPHGFNTLAGTAVKELAAGEDYEKVVANIESRLAPANYRRTSKPVSPAMVRKARETIDELGLREALERRLVQPDEVPLEHQVWTRPAPEALDLLDSMAAEATPTQIPEGMPVVEVEAANFLAKAGEFKKLYLETSASAGNQVALTTSQYDPEAKLLSWDNPFGWSYTSSNTADAIVERVKKAGGKHEGALRVSLSWNNHDDLDLHLTHDKSGDYIDFTWRSEWGGELDVDANASKVVNDPVENIIFPVLSQLEEGAYIVDVVQFSKRQPGSGFTLQVAIDGEVYEFHSGSNVTMRNALELEYSGGSVKITKVNSWLTGGLVAAKASLVEVSGIVPTPNHWGGERGTRHDIFLVDGFQPESEVRGFYVEHLPRALNEHRKVFEVLGNRSLIPAPAAPVAGGYGFSRTSGQVARVLAVTNGGKREAYAIKF